MKGMYRVTSYLLRSGQPGPYQDTEYVARVHFERSIWDKPKVLADEYIDEETARRRLSSVEGFTSTPWKGRRDHWTTYLDYLVMVDGKRASELIPGGDPGQTLASTWEFRTVSPYTD